jgi:hypothetical protein
VACLAFLIPVNPLPLILSDAFAFTPADHGRILVSFVVGVVHAATGRQPLDRIHRIFRIYRACPGLDPGISNLELLCLAEFMKLSAQTFLSC